VLEFGQLFRALEIALLGRVSRVFLALRSGWKPRIA